MRRGKAVTMGLAGMLAWWTVASAAEPPLGGAWVSAVEGDTASSPRARATNSSRRRACCPSGGECGAGTRQTAKRPSSQPA